MRNPSSIDLILTNRPRSFQNSTVIETGLSDHDKLTVTVMKSFFQKQVPKTIYYRDYKKMNHSLFRSDLLRELYSTNNGKITYDVLEEIIVRILDHHAPQAKNYPGK